MSGFTIHSGQYKASNLTMEAMKLKESFFRGLRKNYTIIYPDGTKIHCEVIEK